MTSFSSLIMVSLNLSFPVESDTWPSQRQFLLPALFLLGYGLYFPVSLHVL